MPSASPGAPVAFAQASPGAPNSSLQSLTSFLFRQKRFIAYISGSQVSILSGPNQLVHVVDFEKELVAISTELSTGKIAVADKFDVHVLEPVTEGWTKTRWERALLLHQGLRGSNEIAHLSWGNEGELLVSGSQEISLYSTPPISSASTPIDRPTRSPESPEARLPQWSNTVSSPIQYAVFSPSANLIATCGSRDRLVKIWRRLSYEEKLFDHTYLPHAGSVTHIEWRPVDVRSPEEADEESIVSGRHHDEQPEFLYTIATDGVLRVWRTGSVHDLDILSLNMTFDLVGAIPQSPSMSKQAQGPASTTPARYAFVLPSSEFCNAVRSRIGLNLDGKLSHSLEFLKEMASKASDVVVTMDGRNRMSAWGLQSVGHKRRPTTPSLAEVFHIAHAEDLAFNLSNDMNARFRVWFDDASLHLLVHSFTGYVQWWQTSVESFFSTSAPGEERMRLAAIWTGQNRPVSGIKSHGGVLTWDSTGLLACWKKGGSAGDYDVCQTIKGKTTIDATVVDWGETLATVEDDPPRLGLKTWDGKDIDEAALPCIGRLTTNRIRSAQGTTSQLVVLSNTGKGTSLIFTSGEGGLKQMRKFPACPDCDAQSMLSRAVLDPDYLDRFGVIQTDVSGVLSLYHIDTSDNGRDTTGLHVVSIDSGVKSPNVLEVNNDFAVVASAKSRQLAVVSLRNGYVEHSMPTTEQDVRHVCLLHEQKLIAIGYHTTVELWASASYGRINTQSSWALLQRLSIKDTGLTVNGLAWQHDATLIIASANGLFSTEARASVASIHAASQDALEIATGSSASIELSQISQQLSVPLPVWHPRLIERLYKQGKDRLVVGIFRRLHEKLKFWSPGDPLHGLLKIPAEQLYGSEEMHKPAELDDHTIDGLSSLLEENELPDISRSEQQALKLLVKTVIYCSEHSAGLDNNALRYLFAWRLQVLENDGKSQPEQANGHIRRETKPEPVFVPTMQWRDIAFAYLSTSQQPLLDLLMSHYDNKVTWSTVSKLGITAWLNSEALTQIFEALAQSAYRQTSPPDPTNASLYFLALHKKPTLLALWRIATGNKEQRATMKFLQRDFSKAEHQTAAKKNAYVLMGKRRFDYAAAFFLLANDAASATSLLAGQCNDVMLAIAVARLYSGDKSSMLAGILQNRLMPDALKSGDRWLMCWCHCVLDHKQEAADSLAMPLEGVRRWHQDEPDAMSMFSRLRNADSEYEWDAVLRTAGVLRCMGLWLPALELVSAWKFRPPASLVKPPHGAISNGVPAAILSFDSSENSEISNGSTTSDSLPLRPAKQTEQPSILDGISTPVAAQDDAATRQAKAAELMAKIKANKATAMNSAVVVEKPEPAPTQFKEPDANSLLDSFGF